MNSTTIKISQVETLLQNIASPKVTKKSLSAYWVMEDGKLTCKWVSQ
jgi:hypothetical protein